MNTNTGPLRVKLIRRLKELEQDLIAVERVEALAVEMGFELPLEIGDESETPAQEGK